MKTTKLTLLAISAIVISACSASKKSSTSMASTNSSHTTESSANSANTTATANAPSVTKPANGIYAPGNEELTAIQAQYKEVTLEKLNEGHVIYTQGACINCHGAKNIYKRGEANWKEIIDDMARKAKISEEQKDAVYKYVLAIKAVQPKEAK